MKRITIHIIRFALLFLVVFFLLSTWASFNSQLEQKIFATNSFHGATVKRIPALVDWTESNDIRKKMLFLGSSALYRGVDPAKIEDKEWTVFNGGSSGQRLMNSYYLLEEVTRRTKVDALVLETFPRLWGRGNGVESARDHIVNNPEYPTIASARMAVSSMDVRNCFLASFYAIKRGVYNRRAISVSKIPEDEFHVNGFVYTTSEKKAQPQEPLGEKTKMNRQEKRWFRKIESHCDENNIELIILIPPEVNPTEYISPFEGHLTIIDSQQAPLQPSLFYDNHHLYGEGAVIFSTWLNARLKPLLIK